MARGGQGQPEALRKGPRLLHCDQARPVTVAAVAVPPAAGAAAFAVASLGALIAFVVAWGLAHGWGYTFGYLIRQVANWTISASVKGFGFSVTPFHALIHVDTYIVRQLSQFQAMSEHAMVYTFGVAMQLSQWTAITVAKLAEDTYHGITNRVHTVTHTITERITHTVVKPITRTITATAGITRATFNTLAHRVTALEARVRSIAHAATGAVALPFPRIGQLEREARSTSKWLSRHRWLAAYTTLAALGAAALSRLGLGFLRCTNFRKAGKRTCGMDGSLLDALIADTLLVVGTLSLVEFAKEMETVTGEVAPLLQRFWRAV